MLQSMQLQTNLILYAETGRNHSDHWDPVAENRVPSSKAREDLALATS